VDNHLINFFGETGIWTQGFMLAKQALSNQIL
jgi:hypothetical protein